MKRSASPISEARAASTPFAWSQPESFHLAVGLGQRRSEGVVNEENCCHASPCACAQADTLLYNNYSSSCFSINNFLPSEDPSIVALPGAIENSFPECHVSCCEASFNSHEPSKLYEPVPPSPSPALGKTPATVQKKKWCRSISSRLASFFASMRCALSCSSSETLLRTTDPSPPSLQGQSKSLTATDVSLSHEPFFTSCASQSFVTPSFNSGSIRAFGSTAIPCRGSFSNPPVLHQTQHDPAVNHCVICQRPQRLVPSPFDVSQTPRGEGYWSDCPCDVFVHKGWCLRKMMSTGSSSFKRLRACFHTCRRL